MERAIEQPSPSVAVEIDGTRIEVPAGMTVAAAVARARDQDGAPVHDEGVVFRRSAGGEPRSAVCGMGICHECRATVDGRAQQRTCLLVCEEGMLVETVPLDLPIVTATTAPPSTRALGRRPVRVRPGLVALPTDADVVIVGAGPAGLAAARGAGAAGRDVLLLDENPTPGGQIWRGNGDPRSVPQSARHVAGATVVDHRPGIVSVLHDGQLCDVRYSDLVLATGSRELLLPFPGWTLPGVFGAGGLQALVKAGWPIAGRKVLVAGTGPLLLAVAALLRDKGAEVLLIAEQAPLSSVVRFGLGLAETPRKWGEALALRARLAGVPYRVGCWVEAAEGSAAVKRVVLTDGRTRWSESCDALACAFGLEPANELARLIGCDLDDDGFVRVDSRQVTSVPHVYAAGEITGIGGVDLSIAEGEVVGAALAGAGTIEGGMAVVRAKAARIAQRMREAFRLRPELLRLATDDTIVCRCEDVTLGAVRAHPAWRDAKLATRCGMGPCQGRVCGSALRATLGWRTDTPRPPLSPVPVGAWLAESESARSKEVACAGTE